MTQEEIYVEADKRYPRRWSGDVENSNNSDKFIEGAEWAREQMVIQVHHALERVFAKEMLDELVKTLKEE